MTNENNTSQETPSREAPWSPDQIDPPGKKSRAGKFTSHLLTLAAVLVAIVFGAWGWHAYMNTPWTRDGTVRVDVITVAPEVSGRIVELPVSDNQFVKKGDLLMKIDPTDYKIALAQAKATLAQAEANKEYINSEIIVQKAQVDAADAQVKQQQAALEFARQQAERYTKLEKLNAGSQQQGQQYRSQLGQQEAALATAKANLIKSQKQINALTAQLQGANADIGKAQSALEKAKVDLKRTELRAPANGWVTNLLVRVGNYASAQRGLIAVVDADSYWIDAYFEETNLKYIQEGDAARVRLMGHKQLIKGHVEGIARAISVSNAQPNNQGVATVNPIFTWVRLAQRIPVRIVIDQVPDSLVLSAGMTATVEVSPTGGESK